MMETKQKQSGIQKTGLFLYQLMQIGWVLAVVAVAVNAALFVTLAAVPQSSERVPLMRVLRFDSGGEVGEGLKTLLLNILDGAVMAPVLFIAGRLARDVSRDHSPFSKDHADRLRLISLLLIALTLLIPPLHMLLTLLFIPDVSAEMSLSAGGLVYAAVFYCLALVFSRGAELQRQADETL
jgi:hypothetical protein